MRLIWSYLRCEVALGRLGEMSGYVLYAMPGSLYSAKARAFMRKHRIDHVERAPGEGHFEREVIPRTGRWIIPVLETDEAVLIQDTVDIIDHLERELLPGRSAYPDSPGSSLWRTCSSCSAARVCCAQRCTTAGTSTTPTSHSCLRISRVPSRPPEPMRRRPCGVRLRERPHAKGHEGVRGQRRDDPGG